MSRRYEPFLYTDIRFNNSGRPFDSSQVTTCSDAILTAFCQLGTFRTGTERAFISLFDATHQLVLAESTSRTPLIPNLPSDACPEPLSLCGQAIPRSHGTCEHVLYLVGGPTFDPNRVDDDPARLPFSFVRDLTKDSRFTSKPYCQFGEGGQFYAAVPIRTRRGINIGSYCVFSSTKMEGWNDHHTDCLREISHAITEHFEANRSKHTYRRSELINRGLASFVEGKSTLSESQDGQDTAISNQQSPKREQHHSNQAAAGPDRASITRAFGPSRRGNGIRSAKNSRQGGNSYSTEGGGTSAIFTRAANIIREAFEVTGCVFHDVTVGSYRPSAISSLRRDQKQNQANTQPSSTSSSEEQLPMLPAEAPDATCGLLGFSTLDAAGSNVAESNSPEGVISKKFLAKLLRRYPNGRIFNFDAVGELQSSDSSEDDDAPQSTNNLITSLDEVIGDNDPSITQQKQAARLFRRQREAASIHQAFPGARSVAFFPLWDSGRERWVAGGFVYTLTPTRVLTNEGELSFLKAFGRLIGTELQNTETRQSNKAKSDALGSLSHELRSPLHGVILGTELLNDTNLSVFQGNAAHTIETCCRTLLDTIDHLLDFSKVNSFVRKRKPGDKMISSGSRKLASSDQFGKKMLYSDVRLDELIEEVAESIFAGYSFQKMSVRQLSRQDHSTHLDTMALNRMDSAQALEQLGPDLDSEGKHGPHFQHLAVFLSIESACDWGFHLQAGAIRRIVMNLIGNSLKYTESGIIRIFLSQEVNAAKSTKSERTIKLVVQDTGIGIGEDYLRHKLFKPFAQEDHLAPGTGLGLSLVKNIVSNLGGRIALDSEVGVGTTVTVTLPLEPTTQTSIVAGDDKVFHEQTKELGQFRIQLSGFDCSGDGSGTDRERTIIEDMCRQSLNSEVISEEQASQKPADVVIWAANTNLASLEQGSQLSTAPSVVICRNALVAYRQSTMYTSVDQKSVVEFISQP